MASILDLLEGRKAPAAKKPEEPEQPFSEPLPRALRDLRVTQIRRMKYRRHLLSDFKAFSKHFWKVLEPDTRLVWTWHLDILADEMTSAAPGSSTVFNVPPGTGKSILFVLFRAWLWARNPALRFLAASYGAHLSLRDNGKLRDLVQSSEFRAMFPKVVLRNDAKEKIETTSGGWSFATSVGGAGTGEHPDYKFIDDPVSEQQSRSKTELEAANKWLDRTLSLRGLTRGVRTFLIMQRLHEEDPTGHVLRQGGWKLIRFPMRYEKCTCRKPYYCAGCGLELSTLEGVYAPIGEEPREKGIGHSATLLGVGATTVVGSRVRGEAKSTDVSMECFATIDRVDATESIVADATERGAAETGEARPVSGGQLDQEVRVAQMASRNYTHLLQPHHPNSPPERLCGPIYSREQQDITICPMHKSDPDWRPDPRDPRTIPGELLMPALLTEQMVRDAELKLGPFGTAGQMQQRPSPEGGGLFRREWFRIVDILPSVTRQHRRIARGWDTAGTEQGGDWTVGVKILQIEIEAEQVKPGGVIIPAQYHYYVVSVVRDQTANVDRMMRATAESDGKEVDQREEKEGGASGVAVIASRAQALRGYSYSGVQISGDKVTRAKPFRTQCEAGNVFLLRGEWNDAYLDELTHFPTGMNDDQVDGSSCAFNALLLEKPKRRRATWGTRMGVKVA